MKISSPFDKVIRLRILLDEAGCLRKLSASGHAGHGKKGYDIVCSAVTVTVRTVCRLAEDAEGIESTGGADSEGSLQIEIRKVSPLKKAWLQGVTDYLVCALSDLSAEFPDRISIDIRTGR